MPNLYLPVSATVISAIILGVYCLKKKLKIRENTLYFIMLISILCDSILVSCIFLNAYTSLNKVLINILNRIDFMMLFCWSTCLYLYTFSVLYKGDDSFDAKFKVAKSVSISIASVLCVVMWCLDIEIIYIDNTKATAQGDAVNFSIVSCVLFFLSSFFSILITPGEIRQKAKKRVIPVYVSLAVTLIIAALFAINPYIICISMGLTVVNLIMYFTIENPDLQMLDVVQMAKEEAMKANQAKTDFLSSMSHEIRTPLNAILGFSECLMDEDDIEMVRDEAKDIVNASNILLELVNGLLDISKIESGKMEIVNKEYDIAEVASNVTKLVRTRIGDKPVALNLGIAQNIPGLLYGDEAKVRQIMTNILTNAVKYTDKGSVTFTLTCTNEGSTSNLVICVVDTGRGIKKEDMDSLFDKFKRLDEDKNSAIEGTGLGLSITEKLVHMLDGDITVKSTYGEGTEFTVYIPQTIRSMEKAAKKQDESASLSFVGKRIMIVDDNELNIKVESLLIRKYKTAVDSALSGAECIRKCLENTYDLILMDDMMPEMNGTETMKILKETYHYETPVVVLTANAIEGMKDDYIRSGFDDYLAKPMEKKEIIRVLNRFLAAGMQT